MFVLFLFSLLTVALAGLELAETLLPLHPLSAGITAVVAHACDWSTQEEKKRDQEF